jgi:hypothetical protein
VKYTVVAQDGSMQDYTITVTVASESEKLMTEFMFKSLNPAVKGIIDEVNRTIRLTVPEGTDVTKLVASFSYIGKYVEVKGEAEAEWVMQASGVTVNDYSREVAYRIFAHNGTAKVYRVYVDISSQLNR